MQEFNFNQHITQLLKADNRLVDEENDLQINVLRDLVNNLDSQLVELLISDDKVKEKFFIQVKDVYVFKQNDFIFYLDSKVLDGSYTQYANRIGLASGGKFLTDNTDYVLDFPYKDCVLEGGQSTEEGNDVYFEYDADANDYVEKTAKRKEIFYNNIIAKDEIDRLLEPKAFQKVVRYDANSETIPTSFTRDAELNRQRGLPEDTITDNLIIKGNNLLALHSLEKEFKGKVKLIYIDPPYNTGSDSFKYNDTFTESTWLTFMHNRLKAAHSLLDKSGVLLVQINDHNQTYLKILLDEVFKKENFINIISIRTKSPSGFKTVNLGLFETAEYILIYGKSKNDFKYNPQYVDSGYDENYTGYISNITEDPENWIIDDIRKIICREEGIDPDTTHQPYSKVKEKIGEGLYFQKLSDLALANANSVFRLTAIGDDAGKETVDAKKKSKKNPEKVLIVSREQNDSRYILNGQEIAFYSKKIKEIDGKKIPTTILTNIWSDIAYEGIASEGGVTLKKGKKPEKLLRRIIEMSTNENDLVLDYHLGSGTTAAVAHKLKRQYIGLEQLNYGENDSVKRLNNVINGDTTGISKSVNWQGGGSFVYAELAKNNETAKERIDACNSLDELVQLFEELNTRYFLDYNVRIKYFKENVVKEEAFINLSLARQKELFKRMLDNNQLYVNLSEVEDARYNLSEDAIRLTKDFYQIKN